MADKQLEAFRTRWRRWLGQKMRFPYLVDLMDANYSGWPRQVLGEEMEASEHPWLDAINRATWDDLSRLDIINLDFNQARRR